MTLLEDLEAAAQVADVNANQCNVAGCVREANECKTFAVRLRAHAARLRDRLEFLRDLDDDRIKAWKIQVYAELTGINNGPVTR